ncbi:hypothetical protein FTUN_8790 [Frigoriglobus tundricola]|uniref:Uncharacterized protein n=1 Tax=Frigoriglobus tundricola TaxID=2774151 RepID=A0A6M5Z714_9BACT|nr:hypothetical protein FTUN_8790 [Frigoriglobus tundricola]
MRRKMQHREQRSHARNLRTQCTVYKKRQPSDARGSHFKN